MRIYLGTIIIKLVKQLLIVLALFEICRWLFYLFNYSAFKLLKVNEFIKISLIGLRFDISAILTFNSLFILLSTLPISLVSSKRYQKMLRFLFLSTNFILLLTNCIDFEYFKFIFKRSSIDLLSLASTGDDLLNLAPKYIHDFWLALLVWAILCFILTYSYNIISIPTISAQNSAKIRPTLIIQILQKWLIFLLLISLCVIGVRGGIQLRPITIISAGESVSPEYIPLVINTPFSMMKSVGSTALKEKKYFSTDELKKLYSPIHKSNNGNRSFRKLNVVVIIMESFSKEYIGGLNEYEGYTPFLDSLLKESLVFDHAFANGKKSIEGIPAVTASIPQLMNTPYILSSYSSNKINSLASLLGKYGYQTAFYHGGNNGTMGFDSFCKMAGFEKYYGRKEYPHDKDYDGHWGIYDEEFFQYFSQNLSCTPQPFLGCIFSLSSHHPYTVPDKYKGKFKKGTLVIHESIQYADYALQKFFKTASQTTWFDSTLFVITADHTSIAETPYYNNDVGRYAIPILFYMPNSSLKGINHAVVQQTDILPSILDYLCYPTDFFAYGESVFDTSTQHVAISFLNDLYQIIEDSYVLKFDGEKSIALCNYENDKNLENNLLSREAEIRNRLEIHLKAVIQDYNHRMLYNAMTKDEIK